MTSFDENQKNLDDAIDKHREAVHLRNSYCQKVVQGDLPFHQLVEMAKDPALKALRKIKILKLLTAFPGWTLPAARYAFIANDISDSMKVADCITAPRKTVIISTLMDTNSSAWQRRVRVPTGWPWKGNITSALADLRMGDLPRELREVRYHFDMVDDPPADVQLPSTPQENSATITEMLGGKRLSQEDNPVDNLESLFSEDFTEAGDTDAPGDNLDDLFADDFDEDTDADDSSSDRLTDEDINKMLGF